MIRVLLVDDERLSRKRMRELLELHAGFPVVGEAADLAEAERLAAQLKPGSVVICSATVDPTLPGTMPSG